MWIKGTLLIMFALIIDGLQALIGLGVSIIAVFPGTVGGAAAGCAAGQQVAGSFGCTIGGAVLGVLGSIPLINGALATVTIPLGMAIGFTIDVCLSLTLGAGLMFVLLMFGMFYPKYVWPGSIAEFLPGFDILPGWTAMTILCILRKNAETNQSSLAFKASTSFALITAPNTAIGSAFRGVKNIQQQRTNLALSTGAVTEDQYKQARVESRQNLKENLNNIDGIKSATPITSHAKTA